MLLIKIVSSSLSIHTSFGWPCPWVELASTDLLAYMPLLMFIQEASDCRKWITMST